MNLLKVVMLAVVGVFLAGCASVEPATTRGTSDRATPFAGITDKGTYASIDTNMGEILVKLQPETAPKTVANFVGLAEGSKEFINAKTGTKEKRPYYNGLTFHRVIPDFMIQGGCPLGTGTGGPGYAFADECYERGAEIEEIASQAVAARVFQEILVPYLRKAKKPDKDILVLANACVKSRSGTPLMGKRVSDLLRKTGQSQRLYKKGKLLAKVDYGTLCMANAGPNTNGSQFFIVTRRAGAHWLDGKHTVFGRVIKGMDVAHKIEAVDRDKANKPNKDVVIRSITIGNVD